MEATFNVGTDIDVNRMFDQYLYKRNDENLNVSLSVPHYNGHHPQNPHFDMNDQTFHTPSFGDEDFEIPTMGGHMQPHPHQQHNPHHNPHHPQMEHPQHPPPHHYQMQQHPNSSPHMVNFSEQQQYNHQWHQEPPPQHIPHHNQGYPMQSPPNQNAYPIPSPTGNPPHQTQQMLLMQPPQQSPQMQPQASPQISGGAGNTSYVGRSPQGPHGSTENTSEDSDDNGIPTNTLKRPSPEPIQDPSSSPNSANNNNNSNTNNNNNNKGSGVASKKPKVTKKKKKRDPNEPQKPVSAYALFFRDTQAAIKGQNPTASFGEVSKIVASMWDSLPTDHKNVYKKKTEAAKKEYLKALAAYRASLVSRGSDSEQTQQMYSPPPPSQSQNQSQNTQSTSQAQSQPTQGQNMSSPQQPQQNQPPPQQQQQQHANHPQQSPQHHTQNLPIPQTSPHVTHQGQNQQPQQNVYPPYQSPYRSPPHKQVMMQQNMQMQQQMHNNHNQMGGVQSPQMMNMNPMNQLMGQMNPPPPSTQQQQNTMNQLGHQNMNGMMNMGMPQQYMNQQVHQPQHPNQQQQQAHQMAQHTVPQQQQQQSSQQQGSQQNQQQQPPPPVSGTPPSNDPNLTQQQPQQCIRHGCTNQAIVNSDWEDEYCSNECVITHCRDVFGNWVQSNTQQQQSYSAVK